MNEQGTDVAQALLKEALDRGGSIYFHFDGDTRLFECSYWLDKQRGNHQIA